MKERIREDYNSRLRGFLAEKETFKLVDALEEQMDMSYYGNLDKTPASSVHVPSPYDMLPFPKFIKNISEPKAFNTLKIGPGDFLNPFKSTPVTHPIKVPRERFVKKVYNKKLRRMRGNPLNNMKFYSTTVSRVQHTLNHPIVFMPFTIKK